MELTKRQAEIINILYNQHKDLAEGDDGQRRILTQKIAQQFCFEFGNKWGMKARNRTSDVSKDSIALLVNSGTEDLMDIWDWQNGTTRKPQVFEGSAPTYPGSFGFFVFVTPTNHIEGTGGGGGTDNEELEEMVKGLHDKVDNQTNKIEDLVAVIEFQNRAITDLIAIVTSGKDIKFPVYEGRLGLNIVLTPKKG